MGKEKPTVGVVWVSICFSVFVANTVVSAPHKDAVLHTNAIEQHEKDL